MPKLKSSKSAQKRVRFTKTGKIKHFGAGKSHLLTSKSAKRKRLLSKSRLVSKGEVGSIKRLLPYGA